MGIKTYRVGKLSDGIDARKIPLSAVTSGAGLVFVSGLPPVNHETGDLVRGDILVQTRQCLENVKAAVETAGSSMDKILKTTIYAVNCAYFEDINAIYAEYFPDVNKRPARTFCTVGAWPWEFDIEIEAVALA
ncbi:RidA family protein [Ensifer sp. ENS04]|uniref:RidA family protein n=1 Tax=Ensifer sp. ENS04 TaxID=2769281 RepID=UPI001783E7DB|nr:RidA family protein [Ensifer sp. ENS04]MBD9541435.1 RidA family protein [Ensifer sp. ENS04]